MKEQLYWMYDYKEKRDQEKKIINKRNINLIKKKSKRKSYYKKQTIFEGLVDQETNDSTLNKEN